MLPALSPIQDQESWARTLIDMAAFGKEPITEEEARRRYDSPKDLDVPFGQIVQIEGARIMVPSSEYFGRYCTNSRGEFNLVLFNPKCVLPLLPTAPEPSAWEILIQD